VVAGTGLDGILARRLQLGDPDGAMRYALAAFPVAGVAERILERYFVPGGKAEDVPFRATPAPSLTPSRALLDLLVASNFVEVFLAREGHGNPVGVNYLTKIQLPLLPSLFGAVLAGVELVLMGAGIPTAVPGILDRLSAGQAVELRIDVPGEVSDEPVVTRFDPAEYCAGSAPRLVRPRFLAIIASNTMATLMTTRASGHVDGFVVEGPTAGGHNAPPRGGVRLDESGQPVYGPRDAPDLDAIAALGRPFWLAGSYGRPGRLQAALDLGAAGIQVGTAFAYCEESGIAPEIKTQVHEASRAGSLRVRTDPRASPTNFPFKVVDLPGSVSNPEVFAARTRVCDLGFLRQAYRRSDGAVGWRCPGESPADFLRKGGDPADAEGRKCVCNGLIATIGLGQRRKDGSVEPPMLTSGDDVVDVARYLRPGADRYRASDVLDVLLEGADLQRERARLPSPA
jgi:nitronate monooxygenase